MTAPGHEGQPLPAEDLGIISTKEPNRRASVILYPSGVVRSRDRTYVRYDARQFVDGMSVRKRRRRGFKPEPIITTSRDLREGGLLGREAAYVDLFEKGVSTPVKSDHAEFTSTRPFDGVEFDDDHGNFSSTTVTQTHTERDAEKAYESMTTARRVGVVERDRTIVMDMSGLPNRDQRAIVFSVVRAAREMLVSQKGWSKEEAKKRVTLGFAYRILDAQRLDQLAAEGKAEGVRKTVSTRIEVDQVSKFRPLVARKPRRIRERLAKIRARRREEANLERESEPVEEGALPQSASYSL